MFPPSLDAIGWISLVVTVCLAILFSWYIEPIYFWFTGFFAEKPSELDPASKVRVCEFFLGSSDQRAVSIRMNRDEVIITVQQDIETVFDPDEEIAALRRLVTEVWGTLTPWATAYLAKKQAKVSELVTALATANIRASKAEDAEAKSHKALLEHQAEEESTIEMMTAVHKNRADQAVKEREVADAKIAELVTQLEGTRQTLKLHIEANADNDQKIERFFQRYDRMKRWADHFKEAYKQKRSSLAGVEYELSHRRQEVLDMQDERLKNVELLLSMGQRIVKQAELLSKKAEKKTQE